MTGDASGNWLIPDGSIALPAAAPLSPFRVGPIPRVQFVIEFVGENAVLATSAAALLDGDWSAALGRPEAWVMGHTDTVWKRLGSGTTASYDSLAVAWDLLGSEGNLSSATASQLLARAEEFASHIQRQAVPMPAVADVDRQVRALSGIRDALDVGFSLVAAPPGWVTERALWDVCHRLGLTLSAAGSFDWSNPSHPLPFLSVTPIGATDRFDPAARDRGDVHEGVTVGFSIPRCPNPPAALYAAFHIARQIAEATNGLVMDQDGQVVDNGTQKRLTDELEGALRLFKQAALTPGTAEMTKLFPAN